MFNWGPFLTVLFVLFGLSLLVAGLVLLKRGLWPRRKGTDPHCRHCEYNLTGLQEGICPECGKPWTPATAARGHRQRQPGRIIGGSLFLLAACMWFAIPMADRIVNVNYFSLLPTRAVLLFADTSGSATAQKAIDEMASRLKAGTVSADQAEWFFRKIARFDLKVRQKVIQGERVPYQVVHVIPKVTGVSLSMDASQMELDGQPAELHSGIGTTSLGHSGSRGIIGSSFQCPILGQHVVDMARRLRYTWTGPGGALGSCQYQIPLQGQFEVVPADSPDTVKTVPNEGLQGQLQRCVRVEEFQIESGRSQPPRIWLMLQADHSPLDLAFDVFVRVDGTEYMLSKATLRKSGNYGYQVQGEYKGPMAEAVDIILRSNPDVARQTVDLTEIWEGELVYRSLPLRTQGATVPVAATQPATAPASQPTPTAVEDE